MEILVIKGEGIIIKKRGKKEMGNKKRKKHRGKENRKQNDKKNTLSTRRGSIPKNPSQYMYKAKPVIIIQYYSVLYVKNIYIKYKV